MGLDELEFDRHGVFELGARELLESVAGGGNSVGVNTVCPYGTNPTCAQVNDHCFGSGLNGTCADVNVECSGRQYPNGTCVIRNVDVP